LINALPFYLSDSPTINNSPPGLIISLESSGLDPEWKSKNFVRGVQVVQWTIASKSCHPILIDALSHTIKESIIEQAQGPTTTITTTSAPNIATNNPPAVVEDVLNWTGPGVFTDAVMRYIIARHGIHPRQIVSQSAPVRIGDLLILPVTSFASWESESPRGNEHFAVWHGFFGSWKPKERGGDGN